MQFSVGDHAPDSQVLDEHGTPTRLAELWAAFPLAIFFVRHFG